MAIVDLVVICVADVSCSIIFVDCVLTLLGLLD
jgi:hypothetical protein